MSRKTIADLEPLQLLKNDPAGAAEYLNAALAVGDIEVFLLAIRDVVEAHRGIKQLAHKMDLEPDTLSCILSEETNPNLNGIEALLDALGFRIGIVEKKTDPRFDRMV